MAHCIQAIVTTPDVARRITVNHPEAQVVELTSELRMVPLTDAMFDALCVQKAAQNIEPFWKMNEIVLDYVLECAGDAALGYFETEYFGGAGSQAAALWVGGRPALEPSEGASQVNLMLAALGVKRSISMDEFDTVGLGNFRTMDAFSP